MTGREDDLHEDDLIAQMRRIIPTGTRTLIGSGDDCAQIATPEGHVIVTTDVLVEGHHFRFDWSTPREIGQRAAMQNLADIAAQGGRASAFVVSLTLPDDMGHDAVLDLVAGFSDALTGTGAGIVGGDISGGSELTIAVTALGYCPHGAVTRSGAQPGDVVVVAGTLGHSAMGLSSYLNGIDTVTSIAEGTGGAGGGSGESASRLLDRCRSIYRVPQPLLDAGVEAARCGVHAMMDCSDGLSSDLHRLARASGVSIVLDEEAIASRVAILHPLSTVAGLISATTAVLHGGEDHALIATADERTTLGEHWQVIGRVAATDQPRVLLGCEELHPGGWDHLR